jgi:tRNA A-37 threonylcarbamoyl transferase component Bud32
MTLPVATSRFRARLGGTPGQGEEAALLQSRLAFFGLATALAFILLYVMRLVAHPRPANHLLLLPVAGLVGTWLYCRRGGACPWAALERLDAVLAPAVSVALGTITVSMSPGSAWDGAGFVEPLGRALSFPLVMAAAFLMLARAVVIPSHPLRTLWVSLATAVPAAVGGYLYNVSFPFGTEHALFPSLAEVVWLGLAVGLAVMTSGVTYGLREAAREARQLGQYTLEERIGTGGMGEVYRARHALLRRPVAVKLLPPEQSGGTSVERFDREAQLTALLTHPNTVAVYDYGRTEGGVFYYVMELLDGVDLEELLREEGPQPPARVAHVLRQVCGSLAEAHDLGLIHRDIKPANVILTRRWGLADVVKVVDFGLVKDLAAGAGTGLTAENTLTGTPLYMAPEAIRSARAVGVSSDLYAVGALGYFLLTGRPVFEGESVVEVAGHHLHTEPTPPSKRLGQPVPEALEAAILGCLEKDPQHRPSSAAALLATLEELPGVPEWTQAEAQRRWEQHAARCALPEAGSAAVDKDAAEPVFSGSSAGGTPRATGRG